MIGLPGVAAVWDALPEARIVGGAVRDEIVGRAVADVDFAVPLAPDAVTARLRAARIGVVPTGVKHGTVTAVVGGRGFEVTSLRRDVETDGRHAVVAFTDDWTLDASRRDFTINAMSMARDGAVFDYFGGRADLAAGRVRFVGEAAARIEEDFLRIFRFFRFFARYGRGEPDAAAVRAIAALRGGVARLSVERVWSELKLILAADDPGRAVELMDEVGVLGMVVPGADVARLARLLASGAPADVTLRVAALLPGDVAGFAEAWRLSAAERERLAAMHDDFGLTADADDGDLRRALADAPAEILIGRSWLRGGPGEEGLRARLAGMARPVLPLQGRDVTALGISPGPQVGEILAAVRDWWMRGGCVGDAAACRAEAARLVAGG